MRKEFAALADAYPRSPMYRDRAFARSPVVKLLEKELPAAIVRAIPWLEGRYIVDGSAGQGGWTHTPWIAILDPAVTTSVEEGFDIVYLLSLGGERLYLSLNQGCTTLKKSIGIRGARDELVRRAEIMRTRISGMTNHLSPIAMDLNVQSSVWRAKLYEVGLVVGATYDTSDLPTEDEMLADLQEALQLYRQLSRLGGWEADDDILREAEADGITDSSQRTKRNRQHRAIERQSELQQAKRYRQHRAIERQSNHSRKVKKALGTRCMGCSLKLSDLYGPVAEGCIDAHHLIPLSSLDDDEVVRFDPKKDFAVLCPNCHRVIHRMEDCSDMEGLRKLIASGAGPRPQ
jgi:5-methylcytosine-specific restriction enzyme A